MSAQRSTQPRPRSPVAERIRARIAEQGKTLDDYGASHGRLREDTLRRLEVYLGKSAQWILTGVEVEGVRLVEVEGDLALTGPCSGVFECASTK